MNSGYSVGMDFLDQSRKIQNLGEGTFGSVNLYDTPKGRCVVKSTKLENKSLGYPPDLLAEIDMLIKLRSLPSVVQLKGISFDTKEKKGFLLLEPLDDNLYEWAGKTSFDTRIKYLPRLLSQIGQCLMLMHEFSLIHNDVKTNNILVKETSDGPQFKLADFGKAGPAIELYAPYGGIKKYCPPYHKDVYYSEYWALMVCLVETILGGRRMVHTEKVQSFYRKYQRNNRFSLRECLKSRLNRSYYAMIPQVFWDFIRPILNENTSTIREDLKKAGFYPDPQLREQINVDISKIQTVHPKFAVVEQEFRDRMKKTHSLKYFEKFSHLLNKFLFQVPPDKKFNDLTIRYYAEVAYIITVKGKARRYHYFPNQHQFLEFERAFLSLIEFQINVIQES